MDFTKYYEDIGITEPIINKVNEIITMYKTLIPNQELKGIFITDYIKDDQTRQYESLVLLFSEGVCEAKNFTRDYQIDWGLLNKDKIEYWELKSKNNKLDSFTDESRLTLEVRFQQSTYIILKASKQNCKYLLEFFNKMRE